MARHRTSSSHARVSGWIIASIALAMLFAAGCDDSTAANTPTPDMGPDTPDITDPCGCAADEICVSNTTVTNACFSTDCPDAMCGTDEVCFEGACVSESCAGLACGDSPNICRAGECVIGSCADADVMCPSDQVCVGDVCVESCSGQSDCSPMACIDSYCQPCSDSAQCGDSLVCNIDQCVASCQDDPSTCSADEFCDPTNGLCADRCTSDDFCPGDDICDAATGQCTAPDCTVAGMQGECATGQICLNGRCAAQNPPLTGSFATGVAEMNSSTHRLIGVVGPVEIIGGDGSELRSSTHRLEAGTLRILSADE